MELENSKMGGWLRCYLNLNYLWLSLLPISIICTLLIVLMNQNELLFTADHALSNLELVPDLVFSLLILRLVKTSSNEIPKRINKLMAYELFAKFLVALIVYIAYKNNIVQEKPFPIILSVFYYLIWSTYFKKSKRVLSYYGENA